MARENFRQWVYKRQSDLNRQYENKYEYDPRMYFLKFGVTCFKHGKVFVFQFVTYFWNVKLSDADNGVIANIVSVLKDYLALNISFIILIREILILIFLEN